MGKNIFMYGKEIKLEMGLGGGVGKEIKLSYIMLKGAFQNFFYLLK